MIKYRPHRSTLDESMKGLKVFKTKEEMLEFVKTDWKQYTDAPFTISIDEHDYGEDDRIGWKHWHYVLMDNCCIGMCDLGD